MHFLRQPASHLVQRLLPGSCHLCGRRVTGKLDICDDCRADLPWQGPACPRCAIASPTTAVCGRCQTTPPAFDSCIAALQFSYPLDHLIRRFKFDGDLAVGRMLCDLMSDAFVRPPSSPEVLLPVPLHPTRERERGFNQSALLARHLKRSTGIPLQEKIVTRVKNTDVQSGLDARTRRRNVHGAFAVKPDFAATHVAIIDDVSTTGSTLNEMAQSLKKAGARRVDCWLLARTPWNT